MKLKLNRKIVILILSWSVVLLWMAFIFSLSSQVGDESNLLTTRITVKIINSIKVVVPQVSLDTISLNNIVRKNSHFLVYFFLGILLSFTMGGAGAHKKRNRGIAFFLCALYAMSDELHQSFVPGRGPGFLDVGIDCAGAVVGITMYAAVVKLHQNYSRFRGLIVHQQIAEEKTSAPGTTQGQSKKA